MSPNPFGQLGETSASAIESLIQDLQSAARHQGLLDIGYEFYDSPVGQLLLAATPIGLVKVGFEQTDHQLTLQGLADKVSPRILQSPKLLDPVRKQLDEYFAGTRTDFDVPLDRQLSNGFRKLVVEHLSRIPYGQTQTYSEVANVLDNPKAVRAVGSACATNPIPIIVPCHRVLRSDGSLGGYLGGLPAKTALLNLESGTHDLFS